ncbi:MAG: 16S rRNA (cytosine(1402)-N(4))-methyltransferase RsmH [Candidatus Zambryskibacteria bacterium]|nr:16S rRNA (cytosine(1402)-N(4))-methyltransferase RsmH [Candidatus Zambryskibacteria bacterium]
MHKPVLLKESVDALDLSDDKILIDGTFGAGGHSKEVRKRFGDKVAIYGLDRDPIVAETNQDFTVKTLNFADIDKLHVRPDAILLDLGISSDQLETSGRGFTFQKDEPLDMRMSGVLNQPSSAQTITAADILNSWDEQAIELILRGFGEEKYSYRIAKEIVRTRDLRPFKTTFDLVQTIESVVPKNFKKFRINPATRTFQALRIAVNEELTALENGLEKSFQILKPEGRLAVITFHSLEDRMVKNFFREKAKAGKAELINKKPITPREEETQSNPRSRSAKLRIIKKLL